MKKKDQKIRLFLYDSMKFLLRGQFDRAEDTTIKGTMVDWGTAPEAWDLGKGETAIRGHVFLLKEELLPAVDFLTGPAFQRVQIKDLKGKKIHAYEFVRVKPETFSHVEVWPSLRSKQYHGVPS